MSFHAATHNAVDGGPPWTDTLPKRTRPRSVDNSFKESHSVEYCRLNDCFLICKRPLRAVPMNGRFWPKAAVALKPSRMSELGQRTKPLAR